MLANKLHLSAIPKNSKAEVTSGLQKKTAAPHTSVLGWQHDYTFDEIGKANATASVTVDSNPATRLDEFFYKDLAARSGAVDVPYVVQATDANGTTTRNGGKFLPATPEDFTYDFDGNLTSDGRFTCTWDAENRLVSMETHASVPLAARRKLAFSYDSMGRRIRKSVWHGTSSGGWQLRHKFEFIHESNGWNILAERSGGSTNRFLRTYTWGTDLSGTLSGAGGVGGMLFATLHTSGKTFAYGSDLNGNVTLLVDTVSGQAAATYDYGPFGELLRQSGEYAMLNPFRFSTKYSDDETGLLDYGLRYYDPVTGRWRNRDPIGEQGGKNLGGIKGNNLVNYYDKLGTYITTGPTPQAFKDAVVQAFEKLTMAKLHWRKTSETESVLCATKNGSTELWETLRTAIGSKTKTVRMNYNSNRASGFADAVWIDHNVDLRLWELAGSELTIYDSPPKIKLAKVSFAAVLWHEFGGHTMSGHRHLDEKWNYYDEGNQPAAKRDKNWGRQFDKSITEENRARKILNEPLRAPWYYGLPEKE